MPKWAENLQQRQRPSIHQNSERDHGWLGGASSGFSHDAPQPEPGETGAWGPGLDWPEQRKRTPPALLLNHTQSQKPPPCGFILKYRALSLVPDRSGGLLAVGSSTVPEWIRPHQDLYSPPLLFCSKMCAQTYMCTMCYAFDFRNGSRSRQRSWPPGDDGSIHPVPHEIDIHVIYYGITRLDIMLVIRIACASEYLIMVGQEKKLCIMCSPLPTRLFTTSCAIKITMKGWNKIFFTTRML